jgi:anaerobic dimethyl sulfoxide reductase subunit B
MAKQMGFFYDQTKCMRCLGCEVACKVANQVEPGVQWRWISDIWGGKFPDVTRKFYNNSCLHCENPPCVAACDTGALSKRTEDGIVVVDKSICNGCKRCADACPYGIPKFGKDSLMQKCDFCLSRGGDPACAQFCPSDAISFGEVGEMLAKSKAAKQLEGTAKPALVIVKQK